jgi:beta-glucosidase
VEVTRATLTGRSFETLSGEDPFLGSAMVQPFVRATQEKGIISTVKHWLDNNQEIYRQSMTVDVGERAQHEIYMPVFKAAFEAGAAAVMCSYNKVGGTFACENEHLLKQLLREDLGFKGFVVSDWGATHDAERSAKAGLDVEMPTGEHMEALGDKLESDMALQQRVDQMAVHVVSAMHFVGQFDGRFPVEGWLPAGGLLEKDATSDEHRHVALRTIVESAVLLKNADNALPLATEGKKIAMIGKSCDAVFDQSYQQGSVWAGGGSGYVDTSKGTTPLSSVKKAFTDSEVVSSPDASAAEGADVAVLCVAAHAEEGWDRDNFILPEVEELIAGVRNISEAKVVVIAGVPGAVETEWVEDVDAALMLFMPGEQVGPAVAKLLTGEASPSGRLPISFPVANETRFTQRQYPGWCDGVKGGWCDTMTAHFTEGVLVGYRWNDAMNVSSAFSFGFGLTYTDFTFEGFRAKCVGDKVQVDLNVTNTGSRDGAAVPQLYVGFPSLLPTLRQLRAFSKVQVEARGTVPVSFTLGPSDWSFFDEKSLSWKSAMADKGEAITVSVGSSSSELFWHQEVACREVIT